MRHTLRSWFTRHRQEVRHWASDGGALRLAVQIVRLVS